MTVTFKKVATKSPDAPKRTRVVSATAYPYFDHASSIRVADVIQNVGGGTCAHDFLASKLGYASVRSGTFLTRISAARLFGYISTSAGNYVVTERGRAVLSPVMPEDGVNAKADGFLAVPLFRRVYEDFRGRQLPAEAGIRNLFQNTYGIVPDRVLQAVRVFQNSAEQCGFFHAGRDRLIRPTAVANHIASSTTLVAIPSEDLADKPPQPEERRRAFGGGGGPGDGGGIHSAIIGLLRELPKPDEPWTEKERDDFLTAFTGLVKFIFPARKGEASNA